MRYPELVARAQRAAARFESAWEHRLGNIGSGNIGAEMAAGLAGRSRGEPPGQASGQLAGWPNEMTPPDGWSH